MPFVRLNKANAWSSWQQGLVAGVNCDDMAELQQQLFNLSVGKGHNAIRLFLNYAGSGYALEGRDYVAIGNSYAQQPSGPTSGWNLQALNVWGATYNAPDKKTIAQVGDKITSILDDCAAAGVGVILVMGFWSGDEKSRMWVDKAADTGSLDEIRMGSDVPTTAASVQLALEQFWMATAAKWGQHPALIGYDILNEPISPASVSWPALANRVVNAIRTLDTQTPVVVESRGASPARLSDFLLTDPLVASFAAKKVVFSVHAYDPVGITHAGLADWSYEEMGFTYPVSGSMLDYASNSFRSINTSADLTQVCYQSVVNFQQASKAPIFVGEFSLIDQTKSSGAYVEPSEGSYSRQVTSIEVSAGKVTLVMDNISMAEFPGRLGFRIDFSDKTPAQLAAEGVTVATANGKLTNTVRVTLKKVARDASALSDADKQRYAGFDAIVDQLAIQDREVTIKRADNRYELSMTTAASGIARQPAIMGTDDQGQAVKVRYPAVATVSLAPSLARQPLQDASRVAYARHVVAMCQAQGFSWAWHSASYSHDVMWRASPGVQAVLRDGAMGRKVQA